MLTSRVWDTGVETQNKQRNVRGKTTRDLGGGRGVINSSEHAPNKQKIHHVRRISMPKPTELTV